jgi:hypothetical protein
VQQTRAGIGTEMTFAWTIKKEVAPGELPEAYRPEPTELTARRTAVLDIVARAATQAPAAAPFSKAAGSVRQLRVAPEELLATVSQSFSEKDLTETGVAYRSGGLLELSPIFGTTQTSFQFRYKDKKRIDAVSARGVVSGDCRELARLASEKCNSGAAWEKLSLLSASENDVRLFQQLGRSICPAASLFSLTADMIRPLLAVRPPRYSRKRSLVIPLWQPHTLQNLAPESMLRLVKQLDRLHRLYNLDVGSLFQCWCPSPTELIHFREVAKFKDGNLLAAAFRKSLASSCYLPGAALILLRDRAPVDFGTAVRRLERVIAHSTSFPLPGEAIAALDTLKRSYVRDVLSKLPAASATAGGKQALANCMASELAREWFKCLDQVAAAISICEGSSPQRVNREQLFEMRLKVIDAVSKLYRHLAKLR